MSLTLPPNTAPTLDAFINASVTPVAAPTAAPNTVDSTPPTTGILSRADAAEFKSLPILEISFMVLVIV